MGGFRSLSGCQGEPPEIDIDPATGEEQWLTYEARKRVAKQRKQKEEQQRREYMAKERKRDKAYEDRCRRCSEIGLDLKAQKAAGVPWRAPKVQQVVAERMQMKVVPDTTPEKDKSFWVDAAAEGEARYQAWRLANEADELKRKQHRPLQRVRAKAAWVAEYKRQIERWHMGQITILQFRRFELSIYSDYQKRLKEIG